MPFMVCKGGRFSARDFRTWSGTWICASAPVRERRDRARDRRSLGSVCVNAYARLLACSSIPKARGRTQRHQQWTALDRLRCGHGARNLVSHATEPSIIHLTANDMGTSRKHLLDYSD